MRQLITKILLVVVATGFLIPVFPVKETQAQWVVEFGPAATTLISGILSATGATAGSTSATAVSTATSAVANTSVALATGPIGSGEITLTSIRAALEAPCQVIIKTYTASSAISSTLDISSDAALEAIGGGPGEYVSTSAKLAHAIAAKSCVEGYVEILSHTPKLTANQSQVFIPEQDKFTKIGASLQTAIENLTAQQKATTKDILKAFMIKVILNLNKSLTTQLVNKLVQKYKISDYLAYGDALASQVYSQKYIADNFDGNAETQLMVRSILQSEKLPAKVKTIETMANSQAKQNMAKSCPNAVQDDMYFVNCVAGLGAPASNKTYVISQAVDGANAARTAGKVTAGQEVSQSTGYAPPRNCSGSIAQQKQIDAQLDAAANALDIANQVLASLTSARANQLGNPKAPVVSDADMQKAIAAQAQAQANYNALFKKFEAGGAVDPDTGQPVVDRETGKVKTGAIIDICESIASPAAFVANSLGDFLKQHLDQGSQLQSNNLPFYASFLADVTSNFLTNILTGGKSTTQVLKEAGAGALAGTIIGINTTGGGSGTPPTPYATGDVSVYARPANGSTHTTSLTVGQAYVLVINFSNLIAKSGTTQDPALNPYRALISGVSSQSDSNVTLDAADLAAGNIAFDFTPTTPGPFTISTQFFAHGTQSSPGDIPLNTGGGWKQTFTVSAVNGAFTAIPSVAFTPRGTVTVR